MQYSDNQYGEVFASTYDEWYEDLDDVEGVVDFVLRLACSRRVLELGVGTGRVAIPLAIAGAPKGIVVVGIDSSPLMLEQLRAKPHGLQVDARNGHMVRDMPEGPFGAVLIAYNTLFNLMSESEQQECLRRATQRLAIGGVVIVDCFVPNEDLPDQLVDSSHRRCKDGEILSRWKVDREMQIIEGVFTHVRKDGAKSCFPYSVRYASISQIDDMACEAGLILDQRWSSYAQEEFDENSTRHISVYRSI